MNRYRDWESPIGTYRLTVDADERLVGVHLAGQRHLPPPEFFGVEDPSAAGTAVAQLEEYFAGARQEFDLALAPLGTAFQREVWTALAAVAYGTTATYGELARRLGRPTASRAVGAATGRNPWSIVVPCHRLVGGKGALTGYAGGLAAKEYLLDLERRGMNRIARHGVDGPYHQRG